MIDELLEKDNFYLLVPSKYSDLIEKYSDLIMLNIDDFIIFKTELSQLNIINSIVNDIISSLNKNDLESLIQTLLLMKSQSKVGIVRKTIDLSELFNDLKLEVTATVNKMKVTVILGDFREVLLNEDIGNVDRKMLERVLSPLFNSTTDELFRIFVLENYMFKVKGFVNNEFYEYFPDKLYSLGVFAIPKDERIIEQVKDKLIKNIHLLASVYKEDINFSRTGVYASLVRKHCLYNHVLNKYTIIYLPPLNDCDVHLNNNEKTLLESIRNIFNEKVRVLSEALKLPEKEIVNMVYKKFKIL